MEELVDKEYFLDKLDKKYINYITDDAVRFPNDPYQWIKTMFSIKSIFVSALLASWYKRHMCDSFTVQYYRCGIYYKRNMSYSDGVLTCGHWWGVNN